MIQIVAHRAVIAGLTVVLLAHRAVMPIAVPTGVPLAVIAGLIAVLLVRRAVMPIAVPTGDPLAQIVAPPVHGEPKRIVAATAAAGLVTVARIVVRPARAARIGATEMSSAGRPLTAAAERLRASAANWRQKCDAFCGQPPGRC